MLVGRGMGPAKGASGLELDPEFAPRNYWSRHAMQKDVSRGNRKGKGNADGRTGAPLKRFVSAAGSESVPRTTKPICAIGQAHCSGSRLDAHLPESSFL
jgi:hypothetical protein